MKLSSLFTTGLAALALVVGLQFLPAPQVQAAIENPAIGALGKNTADTASGVQFVSYFVTIWRALTIVGALAVIVYFIWGSIDWIVAGGEAGKIGKARDKMTQAVIGLIILVSSFVIIGFLGQLFFGPNFDILRLDFAGTGATTGTSGTGSTGSSGSGTGTGTGGTGAGRTVPDGLCTSNISRCQSGKGYSDPSFCNGTGPIVCGVKPATGTGTGTGGTGTSNGGSGNGSSANNGAFVFPRSIADGACAQAVSPSGPVDKSSCISPDIYINSAICATLPHMVCGPQP